jgi:hypothetical protein
MSEQDVLDAITRLEAKIDALTKWSGMFDTYGRPITEAEMKERERDADERDRRWLEQQKATA